MSFSERQRRFQVRINHLLSRSFVASLLLLACGSFYFADAQTIAGVTAVNSAPQPTPTPTVRVPVKAGPQFVTGKSNLYCSGFIQYAPAPNNLQIVGGEQEQEQRIYSSGDYVYINAGSQQSVREGDEYIVIRPRGQFKSRHSKKKGWLGVYTQEIASLRVVRVKDRVSVALVSSSCDDILMGDLLRAQPQRVAPVQRPEQNLDRFSDPTGKAKGRIVLARDLREMVTQNNVVFIDLGSEDNVRPGDYLTIFRPVGRGNISRFRDDEVTPPAQSGFGSDIFKGGKFSNKAQRVKDANQTGIFGPIISSPEVWGKRPPMPRKVIGEMVILSVQQRTAAAVITRVAQEVHTGDYVEVQ
jgi:hypothetical protein